MAGEQMGEQMGGETGCADETVELCLLGGFSLSISGVDVEVSPTSQRLLARIALSGGTKSRSSLAGALWPEHAEARAQANLRCAVWRLPFRVRAHIVFRPTTVHLDECWVVDSWRAERLTHRPDGQAAGLADAAEIFRYDLLPDWDEPWLQIERERHRQLRLHALEDVARAHLAAGRPLDAIDFALVAVAAEPLRESAEVLLIRGHTAAGNRAAALEVYDRFCRLLADELGVQPTAEQVLLRQAITAGEPVPATSRSR